MINETNMDAYEVVESILDANDGGIRGRTAIQKLAYLAKQKISGLNIPPYKPHYYGPFSPKLGIMLEKLVSYCFVVETKIPGVMYEGYMYELTKDGKTIIKTIKEEKKGKYNEIKKLVNDCNNFCELKSAPLSYAAKIHYMMHNDHEKLSAEEAIERAGKLNWKMTQENVKQGKILLGKLGLDKI